METIPKPTAHMGAYTVSYNLETGMLTFEKPLACLTMLAPPEFRSSMLAQKTIEDATLVLRTSRLVEHVMIILDTQVLFSTR